MISNAPGGGGGVESECSWKADPAEMFRHGLKLDKCTCNKAALHQLLATYCSFVWFIIIFENTQKREVVAAGSVVKHVELSAIKIRWFNNLDDREQ